MSEGVMSIMFRCAACGQQAMADPDLVMVTDARRGPDGKPEVHPGEKNPLCASCAYLKIRVHRQMGWPVSPQVEEPDYWQRAYYQ